MKHTEAFCVPVYVADTIQGVWVRDASDPNLKGKIGFFLSEEALSNAVVVAFSNGNYRRVDQVRADIGKGVVLEGGAFLMLGDATAPGERASGDQASSRDWRFPVTRFWQCPSCGGILEKSQTTLDVVDKLAGVLGSATCSFCGSSQDAADVYWGAFDFAVSDDFIARMGLDPRFALFDKAVGRWRYKNCLVPLKADGRASQKSTEMDILECVQRQQRAIQELPKPIAHRGSPAAEQMARQIPSSRRVTTGVDRPQKSSPASSKGLLGNLWRRLLDGFRQKPNEP